MGRPQRRRPAGCGQVDVAPRSRANCAKVGVVAPASITLRAAPETSYASCGDLSLSYQVFGDGPVELVWAGSFTSHVELYWTMPEFGSLVEKLGTFARVLLFDKAGAGLSDPVPKFRTLDERAAEIEAVMARAPAHAAEITRMEDQHRDIAEGVASVQDIVASWVTSADPGLAKQLIPAVEDLSAVVGEHLTDEELNIVPLINEHITSVEWQEAVTRAAEFLSMKNLWLGPVLGGYVLDAASGDKGRRLIANVPLPKRMLALLLARRACAIYRRKIYG